MQITVTGRHVDITDSLREHIEKKLDKLHSYSDHMIDVRVVLSVERYRQFAEVTVSGRNNLHVHSEEVTDDMYASIDKAVDKIERQLKRHMDKKRSSKRRREPESEQAATGESAEEEAGEEAEEAIEVHGQFRVTVSNNFPQKPMSVQEAILQLEASGEMFFAFVNEETDEVNVVYKQEEDYGLLRRSF